MNKQAEQALGELLQKAVDGIDGAVEFSQAQIPDVVAQLLQWEFVMSVLWNIPALVAIGVVVFLWRKMLPRMKTEFKKSPQLQDEAVTIGGPIGLGLVTIISIFIVAGFSSFIWLKIWIAPKLFLLEYAREFVG